MIFTRTDNTNRLNEQNIRCNLLEINTKGKINKLFQNIAQTFSLILIQNKNFKNG